MTKTRVTVTLDPDLERWLCAGSRSAGKSLSEMIRVCLREYSEREPNRFLRTDKSRSTSEAAWKTLRPKLD